MKIKVKKVLGTYPSEDIKLPLITDGNACFDFYAPTSFFICGGAKGQKIPTGLAFEIPAGYHMKLFMRSSYGAKSKLRLSNCVGIIDASYRGEVQGLFDNVGYDLEGIQKGDRFMQGLIEKNVDIEFEEVDELTETKRGTGGFGSTGK